MSHVAELVSNILHISAYVTFALASSLGHLTSIIALVVGGSSKKCQSRMLILSFKPMCVMS